MFFNDKRTDLSPEDFRGSLSRLCGDQLTMEEVAYICCLLCLCHMSSRYLDEQQWHCVGMVDEHCVGMVDQHCVGAFVHSAGAGSLCARFSLAACQQTVVQCCQFE